MYQVKEYVIPESVGECYDLFCANRRSRFVAGNMFLRMGNANIPMLIDLSKAGLDQITTDDKGRLHIGAMCTLRRIETDEQIRKAASGILSESCGEILGMQFRSLATIGASVASKYGFSDVITPLLAIGASVVLYGGGEMTLETFLETYRERDLLTEVILPSEEMTGAYCDYRNSQGDFSMLNCAVTYFEGAYRISVGARPGVAKLARNAMEMAGKGVAAEQVADAAAGELSFDSNMRASKEYRSHMCRILVSRLLKQLQEGV